MVLRVKGQGLQRVGSGRTGRTENKWDVIGAGKSAPPEVYLTFTREAHQEESAADHQSNDTSVTGDIAECCSVSEISVQCYFTPSRTCTSNPSGWVKVSCCNLVPYSCQQHPVSELRSVGI
jgi:hypothetical protein